MTRSDRTTRDGDSNASRWPDIRCVGAFECDTGGYWPSHASPLLVEVAPDGRWRRWLYAIRAGHGVVLHQPVGEFTDPERMPFRHGGYLMCPPQRFGPRYQLLILSGPRLVVRRGALRGAATLLRQAFAYRRDPAVRRRCLRGVRNALARS